MEVSEPTEAFKQFDVVTDHSDHHYTNKNAFTDGNGEVRKRIMYEWNIIEQHLPETIFVRAYEGRIDLLRAVIVGAKGTPYHDGIFFFDIAFPSDYPNKPPQVYFHSHGYRLNPNLYNSGFVCLSLLNTWTGNGKERWVPSESTILQVLVSLQGLVLNENPYFNEPGFENFLNGPWKEYNGDAFTYSCKIMLLLLQNPPRNFEVFVRDHFRKHGEGILAACKAYLEGKAAIGYYEASGSPMLPESSILTSSSFKKTLEAVYPTLEEAFQKNSIQHLPN